MSRFDFIPTPLPGLTLVQRRAIEDHRGFLSRLYCADEFGRAGLDKAIRQINHTYTKTRSALRGMHFQYPPHAEAKVVSCLRGEIFDVAVDLRRGSPTFLQWHGVVLSASNRQSLLIPEGFAHGFQALDADCELIYLHTQSYHPDAEGGLHFADPRLGIAWPLPAADVSDRDQGHPFLDDDFQGLEP